MELNPLPDEEAIQWITRYAERWGLDLNDAEPAVEGAPYGAMATRPWPHPLSEASPPSEVMVFCFDPPPWLPPELRRSGPSGPLRRFHRITLDFAIRTGATSIMYGDGLDIYILTHLSPGRISSKSCTSRSRSIGRSNGATAQSRSQAHRSSTNSRRSGVTTGRPVVSITARIEPRRRTSKDDPRRVFRPPGGHLGGRPGPRGRGAEKAGEREGAESGPASGLRVEPTTYSRRV
jgi:hypothetical protein